MIKFQHTIFALPFALASMLIAADGLPSLSIILWIILACVTARTAAMSFNRWADATIDARNPRTASRAIPAGQLTQPFVLAVVLTSSAAFILCAAMINHLALVLSPLALIFLLGYSYTKRFTSFAHLFLGASLALAPIGAWVAIQANISLTAILLGVGVMLWTAGFDLIYACQDLEFDRTFGLHSIPARFGARSALILSRALHALAVLSFTLAGVSSNSGSIYFAGVAAAALLLVAEQLAVDPSDPRRINLAFFTINSWVGVAILAGTAMDRILF